MDWEKVTKVLHLNSDDLARIEAAKARERRRKGCLTILIGAPLLFLLLVNEEKVDDFVEKHSEKAPADKSGVAAETKRKVSPTVVGGSAKKKQNLREIPPSEAEKLLPIIKGDWLQTSSSLYMYRDAVKEVPRRLTFTDTGDLLVEDFRDSQSRIQTQDLLFFAPDTPKPSGNFQQFGVLLPDGSVLIWKDMSGMVFQDSNDEHVVSFSRETDLETFF